MATVFFFLDGAQDASEVAGRYGTSNPPLGIWAFIDGASPSDAVPETPVSTGAGSGGRRFLRKQLWSVEIDGKFHVFDDLDELIAFLSRHEEKEVEQAEVRAERDAKRIVLVGREKAKPKPPVFKVASPVAEIRDFAADVQARIDRVYWKALAAALAREAEEDEDISFIASIDFD